MGFSFRYPRQSVDVDKAEYVRYIMEKKDYGRGYRPTSAEILEFAKRTKVVNLETSVGSLLENMSLVEPPGGVEVAGWGIVNDGYGIVTGSIPEVESKVQGQGQ